MGTQIRDSERDTQSGCPARAVLEQLQLQCLSVKPIMLRKYHSSSWSEQRSVRGSMGHTMGCRFGLHKACKNIYGYMKRMCVLCLHKASLGYVFTLMTLLDLGKLSCSSLPSLGLSDLVHSIFPQTKLKADDALQS